MTIDQQASPAKRRHPRGVAVPIRLQDRDLDILFSLSEGRYLTAPAIEWLHFPGWRDRYKVYLEQRKTNPTAAFYPKSDVYRCLVALRGGDNPLIYRMVRVAEQASQIYNRLPDAYVLAEAGAELLCAQRDYELDALWYEDPRKRSIKNFEHSVAISTFYAALRWSLEFSGQQLTGWRADHLLAGRDRTTGGPGYDRVAVPGGKKDLPILPDGTFTLSGHRYFVEIDRGTTNLASWAEKVRGYEVYRRSPKLAARYQTDTFTVLVVAPGQNRLQRIAEEVIKVTRQPGADYRFVTQDRVEPTAIRPSWKAISDVGWARRKVVDRLVDFPDQLRFIAHPLWKNS
jgi:hypothetical protein